LEKLQSLASPLRLLLAAYVLLVSRLTGDEDIAIGTNSEVDRQPFVLRLPVAYRESFLGARDQGTVYECDTELRCIVECPDVTQNVTDYADDIVPLQDVRSHLKPRNLLWFAAF
jgi:L-aminoadipate-semialdehyde dehydrogenase